MNEQELQADITKVTNEIKVLNEAYKSKSNLDKLIGLFTRIDIDFGKKVLAINMAKNKKSRFCDYIIKGIFLFAILCVLYLLFFLERTPITPEIIPVLLTIGIIVQCSCLFYQSSLKKGHLQKLEQLIDEYNQQTNVSLNISPENLVKACNIVERELKNKDNEQEEQELNRGIQILITQRMELIRRNQQEIEAIKNDIK
ncbi:hypothetical protein [Tetragenococcus halophilus]|uniref:Uncharacterized protein n=1 Tax=Tetragenococcus halophilus TaxID=51669 RepID=A0AB35HRJ8_TETHA|nr:hypothetical protein [Tetragenococcus halophilus]MCO8296225.1 hypothetical protein [Tetragenococcus halophilus]MCO8298792.1 hypothetical protein [Tetragenococcus halophilus]